MRRDIDIYAKDGQHCRLVEASGGASMVNACFSFLRKGSRLVLIGLPKEAIYIENPLPVIQTDVGHYKKKTTNEFRYRLNNLTDRPSLSPHTERGVQINHHDNGARQEDLSYLGAV